MNKSFLTILSLSFSITGLVGCRSDEEQTIVPVIPVSQEVESPASDGVEPPVLKNVEPRFLMTEEDRAQGYKFLGTKKPLDEEVGLASGDVYLECQNPRLKDQRYFILAKDKFETLEKREDKVVLIAESVLQEKTVKFDLLCVVLRNSL